MYIRLSGRIRQSVELQFCLSATSRCVCLALAVQICPFHLLLFQNIYNFFPTQIYIAHFYMLQSSTFEPTSESFLFPSSLQEAHFVLFTHRKSCKYKLLFIFNQCFFSFVILNNKSFRFNVAVIVTKFKYCIADDSYLRTDAKPPKLGKGAHKFFVLFSQF